MKKILVVVDMQKDFIDGSLGTKEASAIVEPVLQKIKAYSTDCIYVTKDTHLEDYLQTQEGHHLPVPHCIKGTLGWELHPAIKEVVKGATILEKPSFGSAELSNILYEESLKTDIIIEMVGLCTDICVVSNALLCKAKMPEVPILVDATCCAGVTPESHKAALLTMKMCQIQVCG